MQKLTLLAFASVLAVAPLADAHVDGNLNGTPKTYCESFAGDQSTHDYAVTGAVGVAYLLWHFVDGNVQDCNLDGVPYDYDGHSEWSAGGAVLLSSDAGAPFSGATSCFGEAPHHPLYPLVSVFDTTFFNVVLIVSVDDFNLNGPDPSTGTDCGDGVDDAGDAWCNNQCSVPFAPGLDGAYHVYVVNEIHHITRSEDPPAPYCMEFDTLLGIWVWVCDYEALAGHVVA